MSILSYKKYKVKTKEYRYYRIVGEQYEGFLKVLDHRIFRCKIKSSWSHTNVTKVTSYIQVLPKQQSK